MSPDQFLNWGATRLSRNSDECVGILPSKVGPVFDLWSALFLLSCGSAVVCNWRPSLLSQKRHQFFKSLHALLGLPSFLIFLALVSKSSSPWPSLAKTQTSKNELCKGWPWPPGDYLVPGIWVTLSSVVTESLLKFQDLCYPDIPLLSLVLMLVSSSLACVWPGTGWFSGMIFQTTAVAAAWCDPWAGASSFPLEALVSSQFSSPDLMPSSWTKPTSGLWAALHGPLLLPAIFQLPRPSLGLNAFWKWQLSGFPQGQEIKFRILSAEQPVGFPVFLTCFCISIWQA